VQPQAERARPSVPEGMRVYAIGDIHGRADLLESLLLCIDKDLKQHPVSQAVEVFVGDYIDRGPDPAGVFDLLIERGQARRTVCLKGNHEVFLIEFLKNPRIFRAWAQNGGLATLASYGLAPPFDLGLREAAELSARLFEAMPPPHKHFLARLDLYWECGDFFFVHAGVHPGRPLSRQREEDLLWIRDEFLDYEEPFEKIIVHGHTPVREPEVRPNRIDIDTGAFATGRLTCLRLEGETISFL